METTVPTGRAEAAMAQFNKETGRYGPITMIGAMILAILAPLYLVLTGGLDISAGMVLTAFLAVAATFVFGAIIEPISYYPVLGPAAMYQAFMIGNIANKLLPAAIIGQASIDAKPGTRRGDIAAVVAICGAATVHLLSLIIFVGLLGTWLVSLIPNDLVEVVRLFILPSLMGAVLVQTIGTLKSLRPTIVAIGVALVLSFIVVPLLPQLGPFVTAIAVVFSITISWLARNRKLYADPSQTLKE